jgi:hypothetical protein
MPSVPLDTVLETDVLAKDLLVNEVCLFSAGTILTPARQDILRKLNVGTVYIHQREKQFRSLKDLFANIDSRFSYAGKNPSMRHIRMWLKDTIANLPFDHR